MCEGGRYGERESEIGRKLLVRKVKLKAVLMAVKRTKASGSPCQWHDIRKAEVPFILPLFIFQFYH